MLKALEDAGDRVGRLDRDYVIEELGAGLTEALIQNEREMAEAIVQTIKSLESVWANPDDKARLRIECLRECVKKHAQTAETGQEMFYAIPPTGAQMLEKKTRELMEGATEKDLDTVFHQCDPSGKGNPAGMIVKAELARRKKLKAIKATRSKADGGLEI